MRLLTPSQHHVFEAVSMNLRAGAKSLIRDYWGVWAKFAFGFCGNHNSISCALGLRLRTTNLRKGFRYGHLAELSDSQ